MYYSYVMGIDNSIYELKKDGFHIEQDENNYMVSFPEDKALLWENYIAKHLELEYWNEYIAGSNVMFLFHLREGIIRYKVSNYKNDEVLTICERLCGCKFESIKDMLLGNNFYKDKID